jgi:hypothetical protein
MNCDRCGRYIPLKASACPTCNASGPPDPDRERRVHQVEQAAEGEKRRFKVALVWTALGVLGVLTWMGSGHFGRNPYARYHDPPAIRTLSMILFCGVVAWTILRSMYRVVTISPRQRRGEWFSAAGELLTIIAVILVFAGMLILGLARRGGN